MAGYRRFAAYVYEYRNGKKAKNCGFIKVEVRDGKCTMEVHLQCPGVASQEVCRIYGFVRGDGLLNGIFLGSCEAKADQVEGTVGADSGDLGNSGISFARLGGVLLLTENGGFFGTEWDDQPIKPANFRELPVKKETQSGRESGEENQREENKQEENQQEENRQEENRQEENQQEEHRQEENQQEENQQEENQAKDHTSKESAEMKAEALENEEEMKEEEMKEAIPSISGAGPRSPKPPIPPMPGARLPEPPKPPMPFPGGLTPPSPVPGGPTPPNPVPGGPTPPSPGSGGPRSMETDAGPRRPFGEEFRPFEDTDLSKCWKIHPQDLPAVSRRLCPMRNNRFLQYGYSSFGHLLLCRRADGKYILGVPGAYDQQERFMAGMFGFPWFKETAYIRVPKGRGGYWYRLLEAVDEG